MPKQPNHSRELGADADSGGSHDAPRVPESWTTKLEVLVTEFLELSTPLLHGKSGALDENSLQRIKRSARELIFAQQGIESHGRQGHALTRLKPSTPALMDFANSVIVRLDDGTFPEFGNGGRNTSAALDRQVPALLGVERIGFARVEALEEERTYRLSQFLRGRDGTIDFIDSHEGGESFTLLDDSWRQSKVHNRLSQFLQAMAKPFRRLPVEGLGETLNELSRRCTPLENDLFPYAGDAPCYFRRSADGKWEVQFKGQNLAVTQKRKWVRALHHLLMHPHQKFGPNELDQFVNYGLVPPARITRCAPDADIETYQAALELKEEELEEAEDDEREKDVRRIAHEIDSLKRRISYLRSVDGRPRETADPFKAVRQRVRKGITDCFALFEECPELRDHLDASIRFRGGVRYEPSAGVDWDFD